MIHFSLPICLLTCWEYVTCKISKSFKRPGKRQPFRTTCNDVTYIIIIHLGFPMCARIEGSQRRIKTNGSRLPEWLGCPNKSKITFDQNCDHACLRQKSYLFFNLNHTKTLDNSIQLSNQFMCKKYNEK